MSRMFICNSAGCNVLMSERGYCAKHLHLKPKPFEYAKRSNDDLYKTAEWKALRHTTIAAHPSCELCESTIHLEVHHKKAARGDKALFYDPKNLLVVCHSCHSVLTGMEIAERRRKKSV